MVPSYKLTLENNLFHEYGYSTSVTVGQKGLCQTVGLMSVNHVYRKTNLAKFLGEDFGDGRNISVDSDTFTGLPIILMMDEDEFSYPSIFSDLKGFKLKFVYENESNNNGSTFGKFGSECIIAVHSPWEVPSPFIRWQPCDTLSDSNILISYKIDYTYSDSDVVDAPIADRDCLYPHERSLRYFSYYSPKNCLFECMANKMAANCGCVTPYMPNSDEVEFCEDSQSKHCVEELLDAHFVDQFASDNICDCLPLCNGIEYTITDLEPMLNFGKQTTQKVIEFRFKDSYINPLHRYLTDSVFKFWINTMTTLDMFLGFSVLSILELIYFLIVIVMRWVDEERHDYKERKEQRKQSLVSAASWCTVCKQMEPFKIARKSTDDSMPIVHKNDPPAYIDDFAFLENHEFTDNCANCRKLQSFGLNKLVIQLLKNEIKKEIEEHLIGFQNHECLSEIRGMIDELRSDIHELKRRREIWE
ncbi:hypothetical protein LSTR_LSTR005023 [Laodelphax striatellus]|uniref:Uncharacterized protein n=1 Tax=Laodelphax striatellus TaxID=195883 RepID=A0A482WUK1_LAOST|nr:hypothetical protein LSTR_LSTR005023 [Laodelphax striatellus]